MGKPEGEIETFMRKKAESLGFKFYKFRSPANDGVPDRVIIGHGYTFFVELKKNEEEEPRRLQKEVINDMIDRGAYVYVIGSKENAEKLLLSFVDKKPPKPKKLKINKKRLGCIS